jgi:hypothetical protein
MSRYTVRVELHNHPQEHDYEILHEAMAQKGFSRFIVDADGDRYRLPLAEYNCDLELDKDEVLAKVKTAAGKVGKKYSILVTRSAGRTWFGLEPA